MFYDLIRPLLFSFDPETAHEAAIAALHWAGRLLSAARPPEASPVEIMGLRFPNRIGLAAGLDKNGEAIDGLARMGFGFLEIGTVTPRAQPGNPRPRLFRLPEARALINRMGFNNYGVNALVANVKAAKYKGILGINIGKNMGTPMARATEDYLAAFAEVYEVASYVAINVSSPNTKNLRQLQEASELDQLLARLKEAQSQLAEQHGRYVPLALKIAPDLDTVEISDIADALRRHLIDAVITTNTTLARDKVAGMPHSDEMGGLSGAPLLDASTAVTRQLAQELAGEVPVIAAGGVLDGADARAKIEAGASLVQVMSGLVFRGPGLVRECVRATAAMPEPESPSESG
ncbi:MAG: quinone-dependent dihydroorotate dehydrogenase [Azoarcus sp.]|jgi:dihydroorotate dehydrogenase|nr:quinone-dependent dihydroorotate dehydrogenase [Azoarcus sp.]